MPTYTFKDEQTVTLFHLLNKRGMLQFPNNSRPKETGKIDDSRYCLYHQNLGHPTKECYMLKRKIQTLIEAKVIQLKSKQKKVLANMATLEVWTNEFPARATPISAGKMVLKTKWAFPDLY